MINAINNRLWTALLGLFLIGASSCGTNTEDPVYSILAFVSPVGTPAVISVAPVETITADTFDYRIEFDVSYYVTNQEDEFIGYNLYMKTSTSSPDDRGGGNPYLPEGTEPTFHHTNVEVDTAAASLVTQRVSYFVAPPSQVSFYFCEEYFFRLAAITSNDLSSNLSPQVSACATTRPDLCPLDSPCYAP